MEHFKHAKNHFLIQYSVVRMSRDPPPDRRVSLKIKSCRNTRITARGHNNNCYDVSTGFAFTGGDVRTRTTTLRAGTVTQYVTT